MKQVCGVKSSLFKEYKFEDHIWYQNRSNRLQGDLLHLAYKATKIDGVCSIRKAGGNSWLDFKSSGDARKECINTWLGATLPSGTIVDADLVNTFFSGETLVWSIDEKGKPTKEYISIGSCPNIFKKMVVPLGPDFVVYDKKQYLNTWYDDMAKAVEENLRLGKLFLVMCYGGLCNGTVDTDNLGDEADRIYKMVVDDVYDNKDFQFLMYFLAANYQKPGINLLVNIWLLGALEGLGKGTLLDLMGWVLGREFVGKLNQEEIEAGWNDHLVGKQLIEVNEFDTNGKMSAESWRKWIKGHTIEPYFKVRQRNTTSYTVLWIGNFIGSSNVEGQSFIDEHDRRNHFIKTTDNPWWVKYAAGLQQKYFEPNPKECAEGFAFILSKVKIDYNFISRSFKNQLRQSIVARNLNAVEEWIENDLTLEMNKWLKSANLYEEFKTWFRIANPSGSIPSLSKWGRMMKGCASRGVQFKRGKNAVEYFFGPAPVVVEIDNSVISDAINKVSKDATPLLVIEMDEPDEPKLDHSKITPAERLRMQLIKDKEAMKIKGDLD